MPEPSRRRALSPLAWLSGLLLIAAAVAVVMVGWEYHARSHSSGAPMRSSPPAASSSSSSAHPVGMTPTRFPPSTSPSPSVAPAKKTGPIRNIYADITTGRLSPKVAHFPELVYVPNNLSNSVTVINPKTFKVVRTFPVGVSPQHITPSYDMQKLYAGNTYSNSLTVIDPRSGRPKGTVNVPDPYNLYFTPDGSYAIDVAERYNTLYFFDPKTWKPRGQVHLKGSGADHLDFSANSDYLLISSEFSGNVTKVSVDQKKVIGGTNVGGEPVDVKVSPDGSVFYVANQGKNGVTLIRPKGMHKEKFLHTGDGAHGLCVSRDAKSLYVSNRLAGTISVIDFAKQKVVKTWKVGGSPDMMQVSPDGRELWVSNRFNSSVSVINTKSGNVMKTIRVGSGPHGLTYFPQPGKYSIGHNGVYR